MEGEATTLGRLGAELWASRSLIAMLARKDFFVRYRRASFGLLWAVGLPVFQAAVLAVVFSQVVRIETGPPYVVFLFAAYVPWSYFSLTLGAAATAIVDNSGLASKIYFPRAALPLTTVLTNLYGSAVTLAVLLGLTVAYGVGIGPAVVLLVPAVALLVMLTGSMSLLASATHVYFRDVRYVTQAAMTVWFYVTPVLYPLDRVPGGIAPLVKLNPMTGVVELFRAATVGADPGWLPTVAVSVVWSLACLAGALVLHRRYDRVFADLL
jgi:ABC-type polysaccharide/polyol phosphate export permease